MLVFKPPTHAQSTKFNKNLLHNFRDETCHYMGRHDFPVECPLHAFCVNNKTITARQSPLKPTYNMPTAWQSVHTSSYFSTSHNSSWYYWQSGSTFVVGTSVSILYYFFSLLAESSFTHEHYGVIMWTELTTAQNTNVTDNRFIQKWERKKTGKILSNTSHILGISWFFVLCSPSNNVAKCDCFLSRLAAALQHLQQQWKGD
jgi:hypothetical protein